MGSRDALGDVLGVAVPGLAKGEGGLGGAAVDVALAADVKVGPLGDGVGARDVGRVGLEEVGLVEGGDGRDAGEDDEEEEEERAAHEDEADEAEGGVCGMLAICSGSGVVGLAQLGGCGGGMRNGGIEVRHTGTSPL